MNRSQRPLNTKGFTIIETLIVLAIAGLILLIVFEAIPTLERNGRNNQRRQDVNIILEAVSHYELNDSGNFPQDCGSSAATDCTNTTGSSTPNDYFLQFNKSKLTYYTDTDQVKLLHQSPGSSQTNTTNTTTSDFVYVMNYQKCDSTNLGQPTFQGAGYNDVVALFAIETGGGPSLQCQQL